MVLLLLGNEAGTHYAALRIVCHRKSNKNSSKPTFPGLNAHTETLPAIYKHVSLAGQGDTWSASEILSAEFAGPFSILDQVEALACLM
jgi:hypothetical protein